MILFFIGIVLALCSEAFFSGAETAFISVNFLKLLHLIEKKNKPAMMVHNLLKKPDRLLTTTLIGTNLSIVVSAACATALFEKVRFADSALLTTIVMTPLSFILCQLLPKTVFRHRANRLVMFVAAPLQWSEKVFWPFVNFFTFFANSVARFVNPHGLKKNPFLTKDEIKSLIKDISREGILEPHEKDAIDKIFDMTLTKAADIMILAKNVVTFDVAETLGAFTEKCRVHHYTRFPVLEGSLLKGVVNVFDVFYAQTEAPPAGSEELPQAPLCWQDWIRPIIRVAPDESLDKIFSKMQPNKDLMAAVFQGDQMVGILTMEDLMEHITSRLTAAKKG